MKKLLSLSEASAYTGLSESTLNKMRMTPGGPRFVKLGARRIAYPLDELNAWLEANMRSSTASAEPDSAG